MSENTLKLDFSKINAKVSPLSQFVDTPSARASGKVKVRSDSLSVLRTAYNDETNSGVTSEDRSKVKKMNSDGITVIVIGASGDLAKKKTYPALMQLYISEFLPKHAQIVGFARSALSNSDLHSRLRPFLLKYDFTEVYLPYWKNRGTTSIFFFLSDLHAITSYVFKNI